MAENLVLTRAGLQKLPLFRMETNPTLDLFVHAADFAGIFGRNEICLKEGLPSEHLLLLLYGGLGVRSKGTELGRVNPGEFCVEGALDLDGQTPRNAEIYPIEDSGIVLYKPEDFRSALALAGPEVADRIYTHIILTQNRRISKMNQGTNYELDIGS